MPTLNVYESSEASPIDGCTGVYVVLAAPSRMAAVEKLRNAGFAAQSIEEAAAGSEHEEAALRQPGVILWRDKWDEPMQWHALSGPS